VDYREARELRDVTADAMAQLLEPHHRVAMLTESEPCMAAVCDHLDNALDEARAAIASFPDIPPTDEPVVCQIVENGCVITSVIGAVVQLDALDEIEVALRRERRERDARRAARSTEANDSEH
jgi:hypothetical protein